MPLERVLLEAWCCRTKKAIRQCHYRFLSASLRRLVDASSHDKRLKDKYVGVLLRLR